MGVEDRRTIEPAQNMNAESAERMKPGFVVAIDGPVASGKGTVAKKLAEHFGAAYLDSGSMYRAFGLHLIQSGISISDEQAVVNELDKVDITIDSQNVYLNGVSVSDKIRTQEISDAASVIGVYAPVQEMLIGIRRELASKLISEGKIVISEGRNEGTTTFPDAAVKIYLTAELETRALRRLPRERQKNSNVTLEEVKNDTEARDKRDMERKVAPLVSHPEQHGYTIIDNTFQEEDETLQILASIVEETKEKNWRDTTN